LGQPVGWVGLGWVEICRRLVGWAGSPGVQIFLLRWVKLACVSQLVVWIGLS